MRTFRLLVIGLLFLLGSTAALAAQYQTCCHQDDCTVVQCVSMGCVSAAPALAPDMVHTTPDISPGGAVSGPVQSAGPLVYRDIWTPPD